MRELKKASYRIFYPDEAELLPVSEPAQKPHILIKGVEKKHCQKCNSWKTLDEFEPDSRKPDGLDTYCVMCGGRGFSEPLNSGGSKKHQQKYSRYFDRL
jgi:hypothetical protein